VINKIKTTCVQSFENKITHYISMISLPGPRCLSTQTGNHNSTTSFMFMCMKWYTYKHKLLKYNKGWFNDEANGDRKEV
jgi:hypothetical protein